MNDLDQLLTAWEKLGPRERKALLAIGMRLWAGQRKFGKLTIDKKDWAYEAVEEALDAAVYLAALLNDKTDKAIASMVSDAENEVTQPNDVRLDQIPGGQLLSVVWNGPV